MKPPTGRGDEHANRAVAQVYLRKAAWTELVIMVKGAKMRLFAVCTVWPSTVWT